MKKKFLFLNGLMLAVGWFFPLSAFAVSDWQLNLTKGVSPMSQDIYGLHMTAMAICAGIGVVVYGILIFTLIRYRQSKGAVPAKFYKNTTLENIWTVIPAVLLVSMAIPATQVMMDMEDSNDSELTIKITGSQWKWKYSYLNQGIEFESELSTPLKQMQGLEKKGVWYLRDVNHPLVLPINKKIRFVVTSSDVIHSWWVPKLGVKRDAIPGFIHEAWTLIKEPGTYRGQCAELCGENHAYMPIVVNAVSEEEFSKWVVAQQTQPHPVAQTHWAMATVMKQGEDLYARNCAGCHQLDGTGIPPLFPSLVTSSVVVGDPVSRHIDLVLKGIPGSAMQAFSPQLNDVALAAIITYERNAWGHKTGDLVTPEDIQLRRSILAQSGD